MGAASTPASEQVIVKTGVPYVIQNINGVDTKIYTDPVATTFSKNVVAGYESFDPRACYENAYQLASDVIEGVYGNHELVAYDNLWTATGKQAVSSCLVCSLCRVTPHLVLCLVCITAAD